MSFTNETTHYGIPLPLGTDLTTPMDYNTSMEAVDTALFGAVSDAATATQDAADAKSTAQGAAGDVTTLTGRVAEVEGTVTTQGQAITGLQNAVIDVRTDLSDAITAVKEPSATASYAHAVGSLFWYNDTLYRTTSAIAVGDTIVPDTNCTTTNVATELGGIADVEADVTSLQGRVTALEGYEVVVAEATQTSNETVKELLDSMYSALHAFDFSEVSDVVLHETDSSGNISVYTLALDASDSTVFLFTKLGFSPTNGGDIVGRVIKTGSQSGAGYWRMNTGGVSYNAQDSQTSFASYKVIARK